MSLYLPKSKKSLKKIENIDSSSLLSLKALIDRKKKTKTQEKTKVQEKTKKIERKLKNRGVEKRNRDRDSRDDSDTDWKRLKRSTESLQKKAEIYNRIVSGIEKQKDSSLYSVDFEKKKSKNPTPPRSRNKVCIKDEFGRDRWVEPGSEEHRDVLRYIEEHRRSQHRYDDEEVDYHEVRIDGGVKSQYDNILSESDKQELERVQEETKRGRELSKQRQKRREEIMNRLQQDTMDTQSDKKRASNLVQNLLKKSQSRSSSNAITDEERTQRLLSDIFQ